MSRNRPNSFSRSSRRWVALIVASALCAGCDSELSGGPSGRADAGPVLADAGPDVRLGADANSDARVAPDADPRPIEIVASAGAPGALQGRDALGRSARARARASSAPRSARSSASTTASTKHTSSRSGASSRTGCGSTSRCPSRRSPRRSPPSASRSRRAQSASRAIKATPERASLFAEAARADDASARAIMGRRLYERLLARRPSEAEVEELTAFWSETSGAPEARAAQWATMSCFALATSVEALFY